MKYVKEKVEKAVNNALPAKDLDLYLKWYKLDLVCIHKWLKNAKIVKHNSYESGESGNPKSQKLKTENCHPMAFSLIQKKRSQALPGTAD